MLFVAKGFKKESTLSIKQDCKSLLGIDEGMQG